MASVFTKIISGELPAHKVYEDERIIAILALDQINMGHTLVIPKVEVNHWFDVPEDDFLHLQKIAQRIGRAIKAATDCPRVLTAAVGFEVPHYHLHLIPAAAIADLNFAKATRRTDDEMRAVLEKIRAHL
ncbi:MAG: HIT family protein [Bdellovibrionaceae bacterium]|nr:HIT family protein [Pseudobdellovibrionaceae bacterium]